MVNTTEKTVRVLETVDYALIRVSPHVGNVVLILHCIESLLYCIIDCIELVFITIRDFIFDLKKIFNTLNE